MTVLTALHVTNIEEVISLSDVYNKHYTENKLGERSFEESLNDFRKDKISEVAKQSYLLEEKIREFLNSLDNEMVFDILTTMYVGRDDTSSKKEPQKLFDERKEEFKYTFGDKERAIHQMDKTPLSDYLREGVKFLNEGKIEI